ncbi:unnamed protein product [Durusdinium trenchii]|uniref:Uncharacterized protein n=1 Tax=Durusdinium trenchii TaxID=1381693 RepID=A0ABP0IQT8_9DINO
MANCSSWHRTTCLFHLTRIHFQRIWVLQKWMNLCQIGVRFVGFPSLGHQTSDQPFPGPVVHPLGSLARNLVFKGHGESALPSHATHQEDVKRWDLQSFPRWHHLTSLPFPTFSSAVLRWDVFATTATAVDGYHVAHDSECPSSDHRPAATIVCPSKYDAPKLRKNFKKALLLAGLWLQLGLALALIVVVLVLAWPLRSLAWIDFCKGAYRHLTDPVMKLRVKIYTIVFSLLPFGLIMPIFGPWERVQKWVRWHPYNLDAELLWRGTFATFALAFFLTAANPKVNNSIVAFFAAHGVCHSVSMFIDNRIFPMDGNDNVEHILEISVFLVIGLFHLFVGHIVWYLHEG